MHDAAEVELGQYARELTEHATLLDRRHRGIGVRRERRAIDPVGRHVRPVVRLAQQAPPDRRQDVGVIAERARIVGFGEQPQRRVGPHRVLALEHLEREPAARATLDRAVRGPAGPDRNLALDLERAVGHHRAVVQPRLAVVDRPRVVASGEAASGHRCRHTRARSRDAFGVLLVRRSSR